MRLGHLSTTSRLTTYAHGLLLQSSLIQSHIDHKHLTSRFASLPSSQDATPHTPPPPTILTLQHHPVYTIGRRELGKIPPSQQTYLTSSGRAQFHESPRGGQITFHAPGQLVIYPILDLRRHKITPRCYIRLLETTTIATLSKFGVDTTTTDNPGVWLPDGERKIASVGVNVRRGITGHGVAINVEDRRGELEWGFGRIVACGLEGKIITWLDRERSRAQRDVGRDEDKNLEVSDVEKVFIQEFANRLGDIDDIYRVEEKDVIEEEQNDTPF